MSWRARLARVPGARRLARALHLAAPAVGYDDRPSAAVRADLARLWWRNRFSRRSILDTTATAVVTMTTHGRRLERVHVALESIARGSVRPRRIVLWLDEQRPLTAPLRRLVRRGLEVAYVEPGWRVHTKYFPYVTEMPAHSRPLVTSDDDILYPPDWLAGLVAAAAREPAVVHCYRAYRIEFEGERLAPYAAWPPCRTTKPGLRVFGTSVSGQILPPRLLDALRDAGTRFLEVAPHADDIWIHRTAVAAGIPVSQITETPQHFPFVPGTQESGLYMTNTWEAGNDRQIAAAYDDADRAALRGDR